VDQNKFKYEPRFRNDVTSFLNVANLLIETEDSNLALEFLDKMLPSYWRDFTPTAITNLKNEIRKHKYTNADYATNEGDDIKSVEHCKNACEHLLRFKIIKEAIKQASPEVPHLIDFGPGDYTLPIGLNAENLPFTYDAIGLYNKAREAAKNILVSRWWEDQPVSRPTWFIAYEVIEHLENEWEIRQAMNRLETHPTRVFLSTPLYTYAEGNPDFRTKKIPHLRTYTPNEFVSICTRMFPEYTFGYITSEVQTLIGDLKNGS